MSDVHPAVVALGFALARNDAVHRRLLREGPTPGYLAAALDAGSDYGAALGEVYRVFGPDPDVFTEAGRVAARIDALVPRPRGTGGV